MKCNHPTEQAFVFGNQIVGIDWGTKDGDKSIMTSGIRHDDGTIEITKIEELGGNENELC